MRLDSERASDKIRPVQIETNVARYAEGSALISMGHTRVLCTASVDTTVPKWLQGSGGGWVTAEYGMLPRSTHTRINREKAMSNGRSQEISRLIGRSLRAAVDLKALGERQIQVDCDVLQADGGTRTAAITGGFVALALSLRFLQQQGTFTKLPLKSYIAAVSTGLWNGEAMLDLNYEEDVAVQTDMNFVMTNKFEFVEIQGTAEGQTFTRQQMDQMADLAATGCKDLFKLQAQSLGGFFPLNEA